MTRHRLTALFAAFLSAFALATAPIALAAGDNAAVAVNTKDDSIVFKLAFDIGRLFSGAPVDQTNAAVAVASCSSCETIAIAIQVLLVTGNPSVVIPENLAVAMNIDCQTCQTLATAYQYILEVGPGPVRLSAAGMKRVNEIRKELQALKDSGLSIDQIQARVEELNQQLVDVLRTEIVPAGNSGDAQDQNAGTQDTGTGTDTSTTPSDTGTSTETTPTTTDTTPTDTTPSGSGTSGPTGPTGSG